MAIAQNRVNSKAWPLGGATQHPIIMQFTDSEQPEQCSYWPENAIDWLNVICVERNVLT